MADAPSQLSRLDQREKALADFVGWFRANYPGPNTIISRPDWHAPKVFRAVEYALQDAGLIASETPRRSFSDFIRNATPEEKEAVYAEVMEKATERQLRATPKTDELEYRSEHGPDKLDGWWWFAQAISLARELERSVTQSASGRVMPTAEELREGMGWMDGDQVDVAMSAISWFIRHRAESSVRNEQ